MKRLLLAFVLIVAWELWGISSVGATTKPKSLYIVCSINLATATSAFVSELTTSAPVVVAATASGPMGADFYAIYQLSSPTSCAALQADSQQSGPFPPGIVLEAETTHKPVLKVA